MGFLPDWLQALADTCPDDAKIMLENTMHKNQVDNTRKWRDKQVASGNRPVTVQCPVDRIEELKSMVAQWRAENG